MYKLFYFGKYKEKKFFCNDLVNYYSYAYYEENNKNWLFCDERCKKTCTFKDKSCIDEIEIAIAGLMYDFITEKSTKPTKIKFFNEKNNFGYFMKIYNEIYILKRSLLCNNFDTNFHIISSKNFRDLYIKKELSLLDKKDIIIFYLFLYLKCINCERPCNRIDIYIDYFLMNPKVFGLYLNKLYESINSKNVLSTINLEQHLKVICRVLSKYAKYDGKLLSIDFNEEINDTYIRNNHNELKKIKTIDGVQKLVKENITKRFEKKLPLLTLKYDNKRSIVHIINQLIVLSENNNTLKNYIQTFNYIHLSLELIIKEQKLNNDDELSAEMIKMATKLSTALNFFNVESKY